MLDSTELDIQMVRIWG